MAIFNICFYFYTLFMVYMALLLPPLLKTMFSPDAIFLSDARFVGSLLPQVEVESSIVQASFAVIAIVIYIPLLFVVDYMSAPIALVVDKFKPVNICRWRAIQGMVFAFFAACLAVLSIYVFNEISIQNSFIPLYLLL